MKINVKVSPNNSQKLYSFDNHISYGIDKSENPEGLYQCTTDNKDFILKQGYDITAIWPSSHQFGPVGVSWRSYRYLGQVEEVEFTFKLKS